MSKKIAVIGLGILGRNLSKFLTSRGAEVISIDSDMNRVDEIKDHVTVAVCLDATNERALAAQDLGKVDAAVVCIGETFQANILATVLLKKMGVPKVITRASRAIERQILKEVGADELIYPEEDTARELSVRLLADSILDLIPLGPNLSGAKIKPPSLFHGRTLAELQLRSMYGINVVAVYDSPSEMETSDSFPQPETVIREGQLLVVVGKQENIAKLAELE